MIEEDVGTSSSKRYCSSYWWILLLLYYYIDGPNCYTHMSSIVERLSTPPTTPLIALLPLIPTPLVQQGDHLIQDQGHGHGQ